MNYPRLVVTGLCLSFGVLSLQGGVTQGDEANLRLILERRPTWYAKAAAATPKLHHRPMTPLRTVRIVPDAASFQGVRAEPVESYAQALGKPLKPGDSLIFDFGEHLVGRLSFGLGEKGQIMDAPCRIRFIFAELPGELRPLREQTNGLCRSWYQDEVVNFDFAPKSYDLPRRYAFRYVRVDVVACPAGKPAIDWIKATAETSADAARLASWTAPNSKAAAIDRVALATLRDCMQTMFEDGPKRDRRLWLGDLRLEALADYQTYRNFDVVKRSLYLLAGATRDDGLVGTDVYERPFPKRGGCNIYDYIALFPTVVHEYLEASGDRQTAEDLWPLCRRQIEWVQSCIDASGLVQLDENWWYFIDWDADLARQVPEQGVVICAMKGLVRLAKALGRENEVAAIPPKIAQMTEAARQRFWNPTRGVFIGEKDPSPSWLAQAWMVLAGVPAASDAQRCLETVMRDAGARHPRTPYGNHYMVEALYAAGLRQSADRLLADYWGGMLDKGADTFWECYVPTDDEASPYGNTFLNSACHAWSCGPSYFLRNPKFKALSSAER